MIELILLIKRENLVFSSNVQQVKCQWCIRHLSTEKFAWRVKFFQLKLSKFQCWGCSGAKNKALTVVQGFTLAGLL